MRLYVALCAILFSGCLCNVDDTGSLICHSFPDATSGSSLDVSNYADTSEIGDASSASPDAGSVNSPDAKPTADGATPDAGKPLPRDAMSVVDLVSGDTKPADAPVEVPAKLDSRPAVVDASVDSGSPARLVLVGTNFWNLDWGIWDDVFVAGATFAAGSNPWRPAFVAEVAKYNGPLRFMDFGNTNWSTEVTWSDRTPPAAPASIQQAHALAYEWMADLCNRTGRDMWVTVPHLADADYQANLARLLLARLDSNLKLYVEWSNETWNGMFSQTDYAYSEGNRLRLNDDPWTAAFQFQVYAAVRLFAQFDAVWEGSARLVKVVSGWSDEPYVASVHLEALASSVINPGRVKANAYAIAPYFGRDVDGNSPQALSELRSSVSDAVAEVRAHADLLRGSGLSLLTYEGGQHVLTGAAVINARPEMYDIYTDYLTRISPMVDVFVHYLHNGQWSPGGAWGAEQRVGTPLSMSHKLRALMDFVSK